MNRLGAGRGVSSRTSIAEKKESSTASSDDTDASFAPKARRKRVRSASSTQVRQARQAKMRMDARANEYKNFSASEREQLIGGGPHPNLGEWMKNIEASWAAPEAAAGSSAASAGGASSSAKKVATFDLIPSIFNPRAAAVSHAAARPRSSRWRRARADGDAIASSSAANERERAALFALRRRLDALEAASGGSGGGQPEESQRAWVAMMEMQESAPVRWLGSSVTPDCGDAALRRMLPMHHYDHACHVAHHREFNRFDRSGLIDALREGRVDASNRQRLERGRGGRRVSVGRSAGANDLRVPPRCPEGLRIMMQIDDPHRDPLAFRAMRNFSRDPHGLARGEWCYPTRALHHLSLSSYPAAHATLAHSHSHTYTHTHALHTLAGASQLARLQSHVLQPHEHLRLCAAAQQLVKGTTKQRLLLKVPSTRSSKI